MISLGHLVMAALFGSAAIAKSHSLATFVDYLRIPFQRHARRVAVAVIGVESTLAAGLIVFAGRPSVLLLTGAFLLAATLFIALRLVPFDETECGCWGLSSTAQAKDPLGLQTSRRTMIVNALRPTWYALRNGALLLATWMLYARAVPNNTSDDVLRVLGIFAICPTIIVSGLVVSILTRRHRLTLAEHPMRNVLAPHLAPLIALSWYMEEASGSAWIASRGSPPQHFQASDPLPSPSTSSRWPHHSDNQHQPSVLAQRLPGSAGGGGVFHGRRRVAVARGVVARGEGGEGGGGIGASWAEAAAEAGAGATPKGERADWLAVLVRMAHAADPKRSAE